MTVIRAAGPGDTPAILRLIRGLAEYERLLAQVTATEAEIHAALFRAQPRAHALLAEHDGAVVGLALFYFTLNTFKVRPNLFLEDLFVEPACRGMGIGLALMRQLAQRAVAEGCLRMEWRVLNWNAPSIAFYERLGAGMMQDWHTRQISGEALAALAQGMSHG